MTFTVICWIRNVPYHRAGLQPCLKVTRLGLMTRYVPVGLAPDVASRDAGQAAPQRRPGSTRDWVPYAILGALGVLLMRRVVDSAMQWFAQLEASMAFFDREQHRRVEVLSEQLRDFSARVSSQLARVQAGVGETEAATKEIWDVWRRHIDPRFTPVAAPVTGDAALARVLDDAN